MLIKLIKLINYQIKEKILRNKYQEFKHKYDNKLKLKTEKNE